MAGKYHDLAADILKNVGGLANVESLTHCITRLRFRLKDEGKADKEVLEGLDGVIQVMQAGGQYQVVVGAKVDDLYEELLGEFKGDDKLIVWTAKNQYYITGYDLGQHFPDDTTYVGRYSPDRVYNLCYYDQGQQYYYMKRFTAELSDKMQDFLDPEDRFVCVTERSGAKLEITYKGAHASRPADLVDVDEFVGVKSHRAKGKRLTTYEVDRLRMIEPEFPPEPEPSEDEMLDGGILSETSDDGTQTSDNVENTSVKEPSKEPSGEIVSDAGLPRTGSEAGGVAFEIERPKGDTEQAIDPEQLNLF